MATNIIKATNDIYADTNGAKPCCVKLPDGTMIVWGETPVTANTSGGKPYAYRGNAEVSVPFFDDFTDDILVGGACATTGLPENCNGGITNLSKTYFRLGLGSNANNDTKTVKWFVIGRWRAYDSAQAPFSYTGTHIYQPEPGSAWTCILTGSGDFSVTESILVDIFCIGGGGGGGAAMENSGYGGGGGGGYGALITNQELVPGVSYTVAIGQGGTGGKYGGGANTPGGDGGVSSFGSLVSANGGKGALGANGRTAAGGVGGNSGGNGGNPGTDGSYGSLQTKYFQETAGQDYAGGGGGGGHWGGNGGTGYAGGGNGGNKSHPVGYSAAANTGGGGGGASEYNGHHNGGDGGSGVVIIRTHR